MKKLTIIPLLVLCISGYGQQRTACDTCIYGTSGITGGAHVIPIGDATKNTTSLRVNGYFPIQQNITGNTTIAYGDSAMPHNHYTSTGLRIIYNVAGEDLAYTHYDTLAAILIYIDTSADVYQTSGYFSGMKKDSADMINFLYDRNTHWMKGYKVTAPLLIHGEYWSTTVIEYLDEKKGKLSKNIIVIK